LLLKELLLLLLVPGPLEIFGTDGKLVKSQTTPRLRRAPQPPAAPARGRSLLLLLSLLLADLLFLLLSLLLADLLFLLLSLLLADLLLLLLKGLLPVLL